MTNNSQTQSWDEIISSEKIVEALKFIGFVSPTPIQYAVIPQAIKHKKDVIGAAETGSGKTLAFTIPIMERWLANGRQNLAKNEISLFALVIAPTRELAIQIKEVFKQLSAKIDQQPRPMHTIAIVGGMSEHKQYRLLRSRPDIVVATPGRLWALKQTGEEHLEDLSGLRILVVDEIDRMLEQGHFEELKHIVQDIHRYRKEHMKMNSSTPDSVQNQDDTSDSPQPQLQTLIFSATLTFTHHIPLRKGEKVGNSQIQSQVDTKQKVRRIAQSMCMRKGANRLAVVDLTTEQKMPKTLVECRMNCMDLLEKDANLFYLLQRYGGRTLVFGNSISAIRRLQALLRKLAGPAMPLPRILHGRMKEKERLKSLERFEASQSSVLLATDVAARGLDFHSVQNIIHYQAPKTTESYIHRSGRTARASKAGLSVLFVDPMDLHHYQKICKNMDKDGDLEVLGVDNEKLMGKCRSLMELATEAESLEHRLRKKKSREQWFKQLAKEADLIWDDDADEDRRNQQEEPGEEHAMRNRKKLVEHALKRLLKTIELPNGNQLDKTDDNIDINSHKEERKEEATGTKEAVRKRLRLERGVKKWFKRPKTK